MHRTKKVGKVFLIFFFAQGVSFILYVGPINDIHIFDNLCQAGYKPTCIPGGSE